MNDFCTHQHLLCQNNLIFKHNNANVSIYYIYHSISKKYIGQA